MHPLHRRHKQMPELINVRKTAQEAASLSEHVSINQDKVKEIAKAWQTHDWSVQRCFDAWKTPLHPYDIRNELDKLHWVLLMDMLNFSFYADDGEAPFAVDGQTGYWSLCAALKRAYTAGVPICQPVEWPNIDWQSVFKGDKSKSAPYGLTMAPLLKERLEIIQETHKILLHTFDGSFVNVVKLANGSARQLVSLLATHFAHFNDKSPYKHMTVHLMKRAQILVADLWAAFEGKSFGAFSDIGEITMFADYRVPQSLVALGLLEYDAYLLEAIKQPFAHHSPLEVEIRANSIHVVELLRNALADLGVQTNAIALDFYLWTYAKSKPLTAPVHKTRCIFY